MSSGYHDWYDCYDQDIMQKYELGNNYNCHCLCDYIVNFDTGDELPFCREMKDINIDGVTIYSCENCQEALIKLGGEHVLS